MIERHWHWKLVAFDGEPVGPSGTIPFAVYVEVVGFLCEADARIAAQDIVQREQYRLTQVWECSSCGFQQQQADAMREIAKAAHD